MGCIITTVNVIMYVIIIVIIMNMCTMYNNTALSTIFVENSFILTYNQYIVDWSKILM